MTAVSAEAQTASDEATRVMNICNACRYCEGLCATFQAMTDYRVFNGTDIDYLSNLCHNCTACLYNCQYAEPHEFAVNVPAALTERRLDSYTRYAWPAFAAGWLEKNGLFVSLTAAIVIAGVLVLAAVLVSPDVLTAAHTGPGAFYRVIDHAVMVAAGTLTFGFSLLAMLVGGVRFMRCCRRAGKPSPGLSAWSATIGNVASMKYLDGGHGEGCHTNAEHFSNARRWFHQLTMWGFLLCFAATSVATVYDYGLGLVAPYPLLSWPVMLGTAGGIGLLIGPVGLFWLKLKNDPQPLIARQLGMDYAFLSLLFLISLTGMALLALRSTSLMAGMLILHLAFVLAFFLVLPYSKFVHSVYRFAALLLFNARGAPR